MFLYRLTPTKYASDTSGVGAKLKGGRWNPQGSPIHYTSSSAALAVLEFLVHVDVSELPPVSLITYQIPDELVAIFQQDLPADWKKSPPTKKLCALGKQWLDSQSSLALIVPAFLFPDGPDTNILVNPLHSDFIQMETVKTVKFEFDPRLLP